MAMKCGCTVMGTYRLGHCEACEARRVIAREKTIARARKSETKAKTSMYNRVTKNRRKAKTAAQWAEEAKDGVLVGSSEGWIDVPWMSPEYEPLATARQVAGDHYTQMDPQPAHVIQSWGLSWALGSALGYIARAGKKGDNPAVQDLKKAIHCLELEIEWLTKQEEENARK